jgi:hypothetical protein
VLSNITIGPKFSVALECKLSNLQARHPHLIPDHIPVNVHCRADVGVSHHFLLNGNRAFHSAQPRAVSVPESVRADLPDSSSLEVGKSRSE